VGLLKKTIKRGLQYGVMILWTCVCIGPFVWILLSSFKPLREITSWPPTLWPQNFTLDNYEEAWNTIPYGRYLLNSLLVSSVSTVSVVLVACLASYSLVVLKSKLSKLVEVLILIGLIMPAQITFIPLFKMCRTFGLVDSYAGLILPYLSTAFGVYMMTSFYKMMPFSLVDAARIDGLGELGIVTRIVMPNAKSGIITLIIFNFQTVWKDLFWPLLLINKTELRTVPIGITAFLQMESQNQGQILAAAIISIIPLFIVYAVFQKQFVQGASFSGLKM
jgi:multiple sugar transport system permease protein